MQGAADGVEQPAAPRSAPTPIGRGFADKLTKNWSGSTAQGVLLAAAWFAASLYIVLWVWGLRPLAFPAQDESVIRQAAALVRQSGSPVLRLPFSDPEDLAHPRNWAAFGDYAIPSYSPFSYYVYGYLTRMGSVGFFLIAAFPATGAAAFALGASRLLPAGRRWLAIVAPVLGFPALYWLLRPWMNISPFLATLCWWFYFWSGWRESNRPRQLFASFALLGAAGAIRPDFAFYVFSIPFLVTVAREPQHWRRVVIGTLCAGAFAVAVNLVLNTVLTGNPFQVAYTALIARDHGEADARQARKLISLLFPLGLDVDAAAAWSYFQKYWLRFGPIAALLSLQLALIPWLYRGSWLSRSLRTLSLVLCACFLYSRMGSVFGSQEAVGAVHHSIPRYQSPLYLFAALPPIWFIAHLQRKLLFYPSAALLVALAVSSGWEILSRQPASIPYIEGANRRGERFIEKLRKTLPKNAMVYSEKLDRWTWASFTTGNIAAHAPTLQSIQRALDAGIPTYVVEDSRRSRLRWLERALARHQLRMVRVGSRPTVFEIKP